MFHAVRTLSSNFMRTLLDVLYLGLPYIKPNRVLITRMVNLTQILVGEFLVFEYE